MDMINDVVLAGGDMLWTWIVLPIVIGLGVYFTIRTGGVQIRLFDPTAITNPRLAALAEKTAADAGIPFQLTVRRSGGTDAAALHLSGRGVPTIVLGIPTRYIHAHNGVLDLRDYRAAVELTVALVRALDREAVEALTHYLP